jgi:hypothetical protein
MRLFKIILMLIMPALVTFGLFSIVEKNMMKKVGNIVYNLS